MVKTTKNTSKKITPSWKRKILKWCWILTSIPFILIGLMLIIASFSDLPSFEELENPRTVEATVVYSIDGKILGKYYSENRVKVSYNELSPHLTNALIATEDERFRTHSGVDANAIMRAVLGAVTMSNKGGGSTITQQLAKMMFHERPNSKLKRIMQKFGEWIIAARLEKQYTKNEIIAMYFNKFDFVNNAVGIHSASKIYFNTTPKKLTIEQSAMLVGMAKNPNIFNPLRRSDTTIHRRMVVLNQMMKNEIITEQEYDSLRQLPLGINYKPDSHNTGSAPYFRGWLNDEIHDILKENNIYKKDGHAYSVRRDGLKIYTTIDSRMQSYAEKAVERHLTNLQKEFDRDIKSNSNFPFAKDVSAKKADEIIRIKLKQTKRYISLYNKGLSESEIMKELKRPVKTNIFDWKSKDYRKSIEISPYDSVKYAEKILKTGMISIEPQTGFIKVWVGGPNYRNFKYDYAVKAQRQVGSTMKPFAYAIALRDGITTPCTTYPNIEYCIDVEKGFFSESWCPSDNFDGISTPVYCALAGSKNNITAKLIKESGGNNKQLVKFLNSIGIENGSIEAVPSLALGVCQMSVLEMTSAQTIFANGGVHVKPTSILRIEDRNGKILYEAKTEVKEVLDGETSYEVLKMMKGTIKGAKRLEDDKVFGTARRLTYNKPYGNISFECAGKTGTTQNSADGWFVGHVPDLVTSIWVGCDNQNIHFNSSSLGQGANMSLPIWGYFIKDVYRDKKIKINRGDFERPCKKCSETIDCLGDDSNIFQ